MHPCLRTRRRRWSHAPTFPNLRCPIAQGTQVASASISRASAKPARRAPRSIGRAASRRRRRLAPPTPTARRLGRAGARRVAILAEGSKFPPMALWMKTRRAPRSAFRPIRILPGLTASVSGALRKATRAVGLRRRPKPGRHRPLERRRPRDPLRRPPDRLRQVRRREPPVRRRPGRPRMADARSARVARRVAASGALRSSARPHFLAVGGQKGGACRRHFVSRQGARHAGASNGSAKYWVSCATFPSRNSMRLTVGTGRPS
jgi:hypothetical protein